jgi:hypothetical protein
MSQTSTLPKSHKEREWLFGKAIQTRIPKGGHARFESYSDECLELASLEADQPRNGWGTAAMNIITQTADEFKINLMVIPAGINKAASESLENFYRRFGFEGEDALHRSHQ